MDRENFFDNLRDDAGAYSEALRAQRQLAYEERVIKRVFAQCGIKINGWGRFANECRSATSQDRLNFEWFNSRFTRFPKLGGKRVPGLHELTTLELFADPSRNKLGRAISRAYDGSIPGHFVFVFPVRRTSFVAHDVEPEGEAPRVVWALHNESKRWYVEPSKGFFQALGSEWFEG